MSAAVNPSVTAAMPATARPAAVLSSVDRARPSVLRSDATVTEFLRPIRGMLDDSGVNELCVNQPGEVFVERAGQWQRHEVPEFTFRHCQSLATAIATLTGQHTNEQNPLLSAALSTGERVQIVQPSATTADQIGVCIRKPSMQVRRLADFAAQGLFERVREVRCELEPFERELLELKAHGKFVEFFRLAVQSHQTIVVAGKTGSGKTTFMKGLVEEVPKHERLITIQDTAELTLPNHPNVVHLFYSKDAQGTARVTAKSLLEACLRMKPDRIFLAEVRGDECFYFVRLAASGHPGSITSVHAGSCALAFEQMSLMIRETGAGGGLRMDEIKWLLSVVVDVIVQFDRDERGRFISEILYEPRRQRLGRWDQQAAA